HLTLDTSPTAVGEAEGRLDDLDWQAARSGQSALVEPFLAHGRLIQRLLPSVDNILKTMMALPRERDQNILHAMILHRQIVSRNEARSFREMLYATSLVMVAFLVYLAVQLRGRANALQRRAALEHIIADISMNFINATPQGIDAEIHRA